jgi:hypothetical protein
MIAPDRPAELHESGSQLSKHLSYPGNCRVLRQIFLSRVQAFTRSKPVKPDNPQLKSRVADG